MFYFMNVTFSKKWQESIVEMRTVQHFNFYYKDKMGWKCILYHVTSVTLTRHWSLKRLDTTIDSKNLYFLPGREWGLQRNG